MRFGQVPRFAQSRCLVAIQRPKRHLSAKYGVQVALALHARLRNLIQVPAHPCRLERDFPLVDFIMAGFAQSHEIGQAILSSLLAEDQVMGFEPSMVFATLLTGIAISHQARDAQIFIKPRRVLYQCRASPLGRALHSPRAV